jgi:hypothetical protein
MGAATAPTERLDRRDARRLVLPVTCVATALAVIVPAVALWAGDRSELHSNTKTTSSQAADIKALQADVNAIKADGAARTERELNTQRQLDRMQQTIDRIADRVGAAKR